LQPGHYARAPLLLALLNQLMRAGSQGRRIEREERGDKTIEIGCVNITERDGGLRDDGRKDTRGKALRQLCGAAPLSLRRSSAAGW
jgi:hypothetical protein